jgi:hypothetical protein
MSGAEQHAFWVQICELHSFPSISRGALGFGITSGTRFPLNFRDFVSRTRFPRFREPHSFPTIL